MTYLPPLNGGRINANITGNTANAGTVISSGTMVLSGGNNVTLSQNGQSIGIAAAGGAAGVNTIGMSNIGNFFGHTDPVTGSAVRVVLAGGTNLVLVQSTDANSATVTFQGVNPTLSGSNGSYTFDTLRFSNANGVSFGTSANGATSAVTASHNGLTSQSNQAFSAGAASSAFQTLSFQDSNGVSFSNNAGAVRVTHGLQHTSATSAITSAALHTSASRVFNLVAATNSTGGGTASLSSNVSFSNANGVSFYTSAGGAVVASHNGLTSQSVQTQSIIRQITMSGNTAGNTASINSGTFVLAGGNNITLSQNNGNTISIIGGAGAGGGIALANSQTTFDAGTVNLLEGGGAITIASSAGGQSYKVSVPATSSLSATGAVSLSTNGSTISIGAPNQTNQTANFYVSSNSTQLSSTAGIDLRSVTFQGAGIASVGVSEGKVLVSVPSGGGGLTNVNLSAGTTSNNLSNMVFSDSNGVSFGLNGSTITASAAGGAAPTGSYFDNMFQQNSVQAISYSTLQTGSSGNVGGRLLIQPLAPGNELFPYNMTASTMLLNFSNNSTSTTLISAAHSSTWFLGVYTRVNSTQLSLLNSVSTSYSMAANGGNSASYRGARWLSFHSSLWSSAPAFAAESRYFFGLMAVTGGAFYSSHSIAGMHLGQSVQRSGYMATGASSNNSFNAWHPFMGVHSLTTFTALPGSIANSEINKATPYANFIPQVIFDAGLGAMG